MAGLELILWFIVQEVNDHVDTPLLPVSSSHCSEISDACLQVLTTVADPRRPHHIHLDVVQRLPEEDVAELLSLLPQKHLPVDEKLHSYAILKFVNKITPYVEKTEIHLQQDLKFS